MSIFTCTKCGKDFPSEAPKKNEFIDPVFGNCWKYVADCPDCGNSCNEKQIPRPSGKSRNKIPVSQSGCCSQGSCCCN